MSKLPFPYKDPLLLPSKVNWRMVGGVALWLGVLAVVIVLVALGVTPT